MKNPLFLTPLIVILLFLNIKNDVWAYNSKNQCVNSLIGDVSFIQKYGEQPNLTTSENLRIQTHLEYVEKLLSHKDVSALPKDLQKQRTKMLDLLHEYWTNGYFPKNYDYPGERKSCFIDKDGNICAMGYLVAQTAGIEVTKKINSIYQYAKIWEMKMTVLDAWIANSGLTEEECAMIQPSYGYFGLDSTVITPTSPQNNQTIQLIAYNHLDCDSTYYTMDNNSNTITINHYTQYVESCGIVMYTYPVIDTLTLGNLENGTYTIEYNLLYRYGVNDYLISRQSKTLTVGSSTAMNEYTANTTITIYPNPSDGHFVIQQNETTVEETEVRLYDLYGREIKRTMLSSGEINAEMDYSDLQAGAYFYSVYAKGKSIASQKLVIIK